MGRGGGRIKGTTEASGHLHLQTTKYNLTPSQSNIKPHTKGLFISVSVSQYIVSSVQLKRAGMLNKKEAKKLSKEYQNQT